MMVRLFLHVVSLHLAQALAAGASPLYCPECNFNGRCSALQVAPADIKDGVPSCLCDAAWRGAACDELALEVTDASLGYQGHSGGQNITSWGGSVVAGDDGTYHMYAAGR